MDVIGLGERAHHNRVLFLILGHLLCFIRIEIDLSDSRAGGSVHALGEESTVLLGVGHGGVIELRMEERINIVRRDTQNRLFPGDQAFIRHIHGDLDCRLGRALAGAGLEHPETAALDGELHILHVLVVLFKPGRDIHELLIGLGHLVVEMHDRIRVADAGDHILTLGVDEIFTHHQFFAGGRVAGECHACG